MKLAKFVNFTTKEFIGYWNGRGKTFAPGQSRFMEDGIARHFAKHLTNKVLIEMGKETATSPKFPEQVPDFISLFNQAYSSVEGLEDEDENTTAANLNRKEISSDLPQSNKPIKVEESTIIEVPDDDDEFEEAKK